MVPLGAFGVSVASSGEEAELKNKSREQTTLLLPLRGLRPESRVAVRKNDSGMYVPW